MRGKLKIFLGYADGVGKTYAMLEAARQRQGEGLDVAVAWVETHDREEAEALNGSFEGLPTRIAYLDGSPVVEMDVDAVLARKPALALVDDLAHHNPAGSRHPNRWQDVVELLEAGIDIYTTLNVQNVESLTDIVRKITGLVVEETVPDSLLDEADQIELVDLPAEELLERFRQGKIRGPAVETFFRKGNLTALREMAMRRAAMRVDDQMRGYLADTAVSGPWAAGERVLVAISSHPLGERLVRAARQLADSLNAEWYAAYVETPGHLQMDALQRARLLQTLRIAEELGAHPVTLTGEAVPETLMEYARRENITRLVVGRPARPAWLDVLRGGSLVDRILRLSGPIDVFVISGEAEAVMPELRKAWDLRAPLPSLLAAAGLAVLVTTLGVISRAWVQPVTLAMLYLAVVVLSGAYLGRAPVVLISLISALAFAYFFTEPFYRFTVEDTSHIITFAGFLVVGLVVSSLAALLRDQVRVSRLREAQATALNALSRDLTGAVGLEEMLAGVVRNVSLTFGREAAVLLPDRELLSDKERLSVRASTPGLALSPLAIEAVKWAYSHRKQAGRGTDTLPDAGVRCLPLETRDGVVGVLAVAPRETGRFLSPEQRALLEGFASLAALAIERARLSEQARQAALLQTTEQLQTALLNSISHDLRTPLSAITGAVSSLLDAEQNEVDLEKESRVDLMENALEEAERLNRLVGNLLDMTRLEAGVMKMKLVTGDVQDVIGAALERAAQRLEGRPVETHIPPGLSPMRFDFVLMVQVLFNLLDNAVKYSPPGTPVEISALSVEDGLEIRVADRGLGIPVADLERIFGKFYRVQRENDVPGTGLGLSICRGIVEAHGGKIHAENRPGGGLVIVIMLPADGGAGRHIGSERKPELEGMKT